MGFQLQSPISQEGSYIKSPVMKFVGLFVLLVVLTFGEVNAQDAKGPWTGLTAKKIMKNPDLLNIKKFIADHPNEVKTVKRKLKNLAEKMEKSEEVNKPKVLGFLKKKLEKMNKDA